MTPERIEGLVRTIPLADLANRLRPDLVRSEPTAAVHSGLESVMRHTLYASVRYGSSITFGPGELHPTSLRTTSGTRIAIATHHDNLEGRHVFDSFVCEDDPDLWDSLGPLPWDTSTRFRPDLPVSRRFHAHLVDHPDRLPASPAGRLDIEVERALAAMSVAVRERRVQLGRFWYSGRQYDGWSFLAPLPMAAMDPPAAVLRPTPERYEVPTILTAHQAFWNTVTVGASPARWMSGIPATQAA